MGCDSTSIRAKVVKGKLTSVEFGKKRMEYLKNVEKGDDKGGNRTRIRTSHPTVVVVDGLRFGGARVGGMVGTPPPVVS